MTGAESPRRIRRPAGPVLLALLGLLLLPGVAGAGALHTALEAAYPGEDAVVEAPLREVRLRFTTPVQPALSSIEVHGPEGVVASSGEPGVVKGSEGRELRLRLSPPPPPGRYTVVWRTAGPDSHPIEGRYAFQVRDTAPADTTPEAAPRPGSAQASGADTSTATPATRGPSAAGDTGAAAPGPDEPPGGAPALQETTGAGEAEGPGPVSIGIRWLFFLSVILMVGTVATRAVVLPRIGRDEELSVAVPRATRGVWILAGVATGLAILALPLRLWIQSVTLFSGDALGASNLASLLFRSPWGAGWFVHAAAVAVFALGVAGARPDGSRKRGWFLMALGALAVCLVPGLSGHAWGDVGARVPALTVDALHVLAAGVWMGGLGTLVFAGLPAVRAVGGKEALPRLLPAVVDAFSRMALFGVALLVTTGVVNAWLRLDGVAQLVSTGYGRTLLLKLAAVAAAMALGFYNWRVVRPSLRESPSPGLVRIPATVEFLLGLVALGITAALVATALPG